MVTKTQTKPKPPAAPAKEQPKPETALAKTGDNEKQQKKQPNEEAIKQFDDTPLGIIKRYCYDPQTKSRLKEMLGQRAGAFIDSIISVVKNHRALQECEPSSVISSALQAAAVNLPIDPILGYAAIVPYNTKTTVVVRGIRYSKIAQFQRMYRGIIQHCLRSNQYKQMHCTEVYADELLSYNPITGDIQFTDQKTWKLRYEATEGVIDPKKVAGVYFYFRLVSGFEHGEFLPAIVAMAHGRRYSKAFQADLKNGTKLSLWSMNPVVMMMKTCIIRSLSKYGVMSIELQDLLTEARQDFEDAADAANAQITGSMGTQPIDAAFEQPEAQAEQQPPAADVLADDDVKKPEPPKQAPPATKTEPAKPARPQIDLKGKYRCEYCSKREKREVILPGNEVEIGTEGEIVCSGCGNSVTKIS